MSEDAVLQQEIDSLKAEISELRRKQEALDKDLGFNFSVYNDHGTVGIPETANQFTKFPALGGPLHQKSDKAQVTLLRTPDGSPSKGMARSMRYEKIPSDISEPEWVLRTQPPVEHKMFDSGVADLIDTDILKSPSKRKSFASSREQQERLQKLDIENFYRAFGRSLFPVVDPSDLRPQESGIVEVKRQMLGLRIEVFNELDRSFEPPHYILFKRSLNNDHWDIFRHTVPSYVGLEEVFEHMRNHNTLSDISQIHTFAKKVYKALQYVSIKMQQLRSLEMSGKVSNLATDPACTIASFKISGVSTLFKLKIEGLEIVAYSCMPLSQKNWATMLLGPVATLNDRLDLLTS
ncbi:LANO_0G16908g1_1 [Lachancea nothofagi CBS 11611]|uniref:LANO_0G16908g1_1 n=1 Tax=Lachancea nothofagi CBS 11611 TaxID=1266666 RepID=A0A1G4KKD8_9SACH|nr:LANO_0G16908g1_1 [Lachancea nothofagi CBS 11611]